jgi:tetratricopeptide (TPR) repeat protein
MSLGRITEVSLGGDLYSVSTELQERPALSIVTVVVCHGEVVSRTVTDASDLDPLVDRGDQLMERIENQHAAVCERLRRRELPLTDRVAAADPPTVEEQLQRGLASFAGSDFAEAARLFREITERDPEFTEARELFQIAVSAESMDIPPAASSADRIREGADAFAEGRLRKAIEHWRGGLLAEPSNEVFRVLLLIASTGASPAAVERRKKYVAELLTVAQDLMRQERASEAYLLFLVAQASDGLQSRLESDRTEIVPPPRFAPRPSSPAETVVGAPLPKALRRKAAPSPASFAEARSGAEDTFYEEIPSLHHSQTFDDDDHEQRTAWEVDAEAEEEPSEEALEAWAPAVESGMDVDEPTVIEAPLPEAPVPTKLPLSPTGSRAAPDDIWTETTIVDETPAPSTPGLSSPMEETVAEAGPGVFGPEEAPSPPSAGSPGARAPVAAPTASPTTPPIAPKPPSPRPRLADVPRPGRGRRVRSPGIVWGGVAAAAVVGAGIGWALWGRAGVSGSEEELAVAGRFLASGQYAEAISAYSAILAEGEQVEAFIGRGRARLASGAAEAGLADLVRAAEAAPQDPAIMEELASALFDRGRFQDAVGRYRETLAKGGDGAEVRHRLAHSLARLGRSGEALTEVEIALARNAEMVEARFLYGQLLSREGRHAEAEQQLIEVRKRVSPSGDLFAVLAVALLEQNKTEESETVAREFLRFDASDARAHALLGETFLRKKQYEPAREELIRALTLNPNEPRAQIALGRAWLALGDLAKARQILVGARGVSEGDRMLVLGDVALAGQLPQEAVGLLERALEAGAHPLSARLSLGAARYANKDLAGAVAELERAAALSPSDPAIPLSLAIVQADLNEPARAAAHFLQALRSAGLSEPAATGNGPVVLPQPYVPLPARFDVTRVMRNACRQALAGNAEDANALALKPLAESSSFVFTRG